MSRYDILCGRVDAKALAARKAELEWAEAEAMPVAEYVKRRNAEEARREKIPQRWRSESCRCTTRYTILQSGKK